MDQSLKFAEIGTTTPFGFGGWLAMTKGTGGQDVMMGELVLLEDEVKFGHVRASRQQSERNSSARSFLL